MINAFSNLRQEEYFTGNEENNRPKIAISGFRFKSVYNSTFRGLAISSE